MSNALSLYYLNQMGITPWICRSNTTTEISTAKVLICSTVTSLHVKYKKILEHVIFFLGLTEDELDLRELESTNQIISTYSPYVLTFGIDKNNLDCVNPASYLVEMNSLDYWLQHPLAKKQLFIMLQLFKNKLSR